MTQEQLKDHERQEAIEAFNKEFDRQGTFFRDIDQEDSKKTKQQIEALRKLRDKTMKWMDSEEGKRMLDAQTREDRKALRDYKSKVDDQAEEILDD